MKHISEGILMGVRNSGLYRFWEQQVLFTGKWKTTLRGYDFVKQEWGWAEMEQLGPCWRTSPASELSMVLAFVETASQPSLAAVPSLWQVLMTSALMSIFKTILHLKVSSKETQLATSFFDVLFFLSLLVPVCLYMYMWVTISSKQVSSLSLRLGAVEVTD